jgi:hypothetical protein
LAIMIMSLDKMPLLPSVHASAITKWLEAPDSVSSDFKSLVEATFTTFRDIMKDPKLCTAFTEGARVCAPVELALSVPLIATHKGSLSTEGLADAIREMRRDVRKKHKDIRTNAQVVKTLHQFICNLQPQTIEPKREPGTSSRSGKKRKAALAPDSDSDDVKPNLQKKATPSWKTTSRGNPTQLPASTPTSSSTSQLFLEQTQSEVHVSHN